MQQDLLPGTLLEAIFHHDRFDVPASEQMILSLQINMVFDQLDILTQQILLLCFQDGLSQTAIALRLKIPVSKTRVLLHRGLLTLRKVGNPPYAALIESIGKRP